MAKSSTVKQLDEWLAIDMGLLLSPFMLTLKHVRQLSHGGLGFLFVYQHHGVYWVDHTQVIRYRNGMRVKPIHITIDVSVKERIKQHVHLRWYFYDREYLYPVQKSKIEKLFGEFWFITDEDPRYRPNVLITELNHRDKDVTIP